jgi:hypothetical protein
MQLVDIHAEYGALPYNWMLNFRTAWWYICKYYLHRMVLVIKPKAMNCVTWVDIFAANLGYELVPDNQYVTDRALEESPLVEYVGDIEGV